MLWDSCLDRFQSGYVNELGDDYVSRNFNLLFHILWSIIQKQQNSSVFAFFAQIGSVKGQMFHSCFVSYEEISCIS